MPDGTEGAPSVIPYPNSFVMAGKGPDSRALAAFSALGDQRLVLLRLFGYGPPVPKGIFTD